jgi:hypothetical protein
VGGLTRFGGVKASDCKNNVVSELKKLKARSDEFPAFVLDLVAFEVPFGFVVSFAKENGFVSLTEAKLCDLVSENLDYVLNRRAEFLRARLDYLVKSSASVVPELESLYKEAKADFRLLKDEGRHKEAVGYLSNLTSMLNTIARLQDVIRDAEKSVNVSVSVHGDFNLRAINNLARDGAIVIENEDLLVERLGLSNKPNSFIERFREK